jgi:hypothetical protein
MGFSDGGRGLISSLGRWGEGGSMSVWGRFTKGGGSFARVFWEGSGGTVFPNPSLAALPFVFVALEHAVVRDWCGAGRRWFRT